MLEYTEKGAKVPDPIAPRRIDSRNAAMISSRVRFLYATDTILLIFLSIHGANIGNISETCGSRGDRYLGMTAAIPQVPNDHVIAEEPLRYICHMVIAS